MVATRAIDDPDRTIGSGSGSNIECTIFALTFAAIDTILRVLFGTILHYFQPAPTSCCERWKFVMTAREVSMKGEYCVNKLMLRSSYRFVIIVCGGLLLSGCVMAEKYDAEKARSLNFQRLLAQEEKRTGELDSEVRRAKNELMEYESRNRELTAQVQATRDQMARAQEEAEAMKESALLERKAKADMKRALKPTGKAPAGESMTDAVDLRAAGSRTAPEASAAPAAAEGSLGGARSMVHVVKPGETLYRISRRYGVAVDKVRKWNKLPDDIIEVGQRLVVGQEQ